MGLFKRNKVSKLESAKQTIEESLGMFMTASHGLAQAIDSLEEIKNENNKEIEQLQSLNHEIESEIIKNTKKKLKIDEFLL